MNDDEIIKKLFDNTGPGTMFNISRGPTWSLAGAKFEKATTEHVLRAMELIRLQHNTADNK